jgi:hypothetical protein
MTVAGDAQAAERGVAAPADPDVRDAVYRALSTGS